MDESPRHGPWVQGKAPGVPHHFMELDWSRRTTSHLGDGVPVGAGHLGAEVDACYRATVAVAEQLAGLRMHQTPLLLMAPAACLGEHEHPEDAIVFIIAGRVEQDVEWIDRR